MRIKDIKESIEDKQLKSSDGNILGKVKVINIQWFFSYKKQMYYNAELFIGEEKRPVMIRAIANEDIDLITCGKARKTEECKHWTIEQMAKQKPETIILFLK